MQISGHKVSEILFTFHHEECGMQKALMAILRAIRALFDNKAEALMLKPWGFF
jgi:hypothetical protein